MKDHYSGALHAPRDKRYKNMTRLLLNSSTLGVSEISYGYSLYVFNGALPTIKLMTGIDGLDKGFYESLLVSAFSMGALIGCVISYFIVQKSRSSRMIIRMMDLFVIIALCLSCIPSIWPIIAGRALQGVMGSLGRVIVPMYVKEITPVEVYGMLGGFDKLFFSVGSILQASAALGFQSTNSLNMENMDQSFWRYYVAFPAIFILIRQFMMIFIFTHESPIYTLQNNQEPQAIKYIESVYKQEYQQEVLEEFKEIIQLRSLNKTTTFGSLFYANNIKKTSVALTVNFVYVMCGLYIISIYSTTIFEKVLPTKHAQILSLILCSSRVFFYSTGAFISQKFGRRNPFLIGSLILVICDIGLGISSYIIDNKQYDDSLLHQIALYGIIVIIFVFSAACFNTLALIYLSHTAELMPAKGLVLCSVATNMINVGNTVIFPLIRNKFGIALNFWMFAAMTSVGMTYLYFNMIDTQGLNEKQISNAYRNKNINENALLSEISCDTTQSFIQQSSDKAK